MKLRQRFLPFLLLTLLLPLAAFADRAADERACCESCEQNMDVLEMTLLITPIVPIDVSAVADCCGSETGNMLIFSSPVTIVIERGAATQSIPCANEKAGDQNVLAGRTEVFLGTSGDVSWYSSVEVFYNTCTDTVTVNFALIWTPGGCSGSCDAAWVTFTSVDGLYGDYTGYSGSICNAGSPTSGFFTVEEVE